MYLFNMLQHYEELNSPYVDMNERKLRNDYLNMMSAPTYNNMVAPQKEDVSRWVVKPQARNGNHISTKSNHQPFRYKQVR
jgi:hypothetical protein